MITLHDHLRDTRVTIQPLANGMWHRISAYNEVTKREMAMQTQDLDVADTMADLLLELVGSPRQN